MNSFTDDVRYALRRMLRTRGFTAIALFSLAVGIGANASVFALVEGFLFRDTPFRDAQELVDVYVHVDAFPYAPLSIPDYRDVLDGTREVFSEMGAAGFTFIQLDRGDRVESVLGEVVTGSWFPLLGLGAAVGRTLLPEDDVSAGAHYVVMLGHGFWQREFGGDPGVVGRTLRINGHGFEVVGVASPEYEGLLRGVAPSVLAPLSMVNALQQGVGGDPLTNRGSQSYFTKARLRPGVSLEEANVTLAGVAAQLKETYPDVWEESRRFVPVPTEDVILNPVVDRYLVPAATLALVLTGVVLLIACANLASFLLARGMDRKKEIAMRLALGARRWTLVRQLLTETTLLALLGGGLGIGISAWTLWLLSTMELPLPGGIHPELKMNGSVLAFGLVLSLVTGLLFGLVPALQSTRPDVAPTLRAESTGGGRPRRFTLRNVLVSGQVAASLVLLVGSGLFLRSLLASRGVDAGFGAEPTAVLSLVVSSERYDPDEGRLFVRSYLDRLQELPGVESVGITDNLHLTTTSINTTNVTVQGVEPPPGRSSFEIDVAQVDPGFFAAAGIPILRGRNFQETDVAGAPPVVIINEAMAQLFWPGEDAVGKTIGSPDGTEMEVVAVTRTTKVRNIGEAPRPLVYRPYSQRYSAFLTVLIRTSRTAEEVLQSGIRILREMDPDMVLVETTTMERHLGVQLFARRLGATVSVVLAALALVLASIGLYGVVSYAVARRSREVGIRMSLGAQPGGVVRQLLWEGMSLVAVGGVIGLGLAMVGAQLLGSLLFGIRTMDPVTFLVVPAILLAVAGLAAYVPARRASRVDPVWALRAE